jgi:hypothetical protein
MAVLMKCLQNTATTFFFFFLCQKARLNKDEIMNNNLKENAVEVVIGSEEPQKEPLVLSDLV